MLSYTLAPYASRLTFHIFGMAERVGFEPTVPLLGRMLSKHVDSTTLAPLRTKFSRGGILACGLMPGKLTAGLIANCDSAQLSNDSPGFGSRLLLGVLHAISQPD